jgi:hypothetical protein
MAGGHFRYHFSNIASVIKTYRLRKLSDDGRRPISQTQLSEVIGYRNGQFISNVERGLCSVPLKKLSLICDVLNVPKKVIAEALIKDYQDDINHFFNIGATNGIQANTAPESTGAGVYFN